MQAEMQKSSLEKTARNWNYDAIRLIAGLFVIMVHVADMNYLRADVGSVNWWIHNIYSSAIRCCVPLFVMVSGVFFLDPRRECAIPELFKRNIFKMARLCVFWAVVYQICNIVSAVAGGRTNEITIKWLFDGVVFSKYHLWFLPMICGLYLVTPILRKITGDRSCMEYLLALSFVFSSVLPMLADFPWGGGYIQHWINWVSVQAVMGFSGFFVLGYYLNEYPVAPRVRKVIFLCGVIGALVVTPVGTWIASSMAGKTTQVFYDYQYPATWAAAAAVFLMMKDWSERHSVPQWAQALVRWCSKRGLGIYLIHVIFVELFRAAGCPYTWPALMIPVTTLLVYVASAAVVYLLEHCPILKNIAL